jgi:hypothetical protein
MRISLFDILRAREMTASRNAMKRYAGGGRWESSAVIFHYLAVSRKAFAVARRPSSPPGVETSGHAVASEVDLFFFFPPITAAPRRIERRE